MKYAAFGWNGVRALPLAAALAALALPSAAIAACEYEGKSYSSPLAACAALLRGLATPESLGMARLDPATGNVSCRGQKKSKDDNPFDQAQAPISCDAASVDAAKVALESPDPYECGMTGAQVAEMKNWIDKPFTSVPSLQRAWEKSVLPQQAQQVASLKADKKKNNDARDDFFDPTRTRFWRAVYDDAGPGGARRMLEKSGFVFASRGTAPVATVGGAPMRLDVDHIGRLSDDPSRMLAADNLRLTSARENQRVFEGVRGRDRFQDIAGYLDKVRKNGGKPPRSRAKNDLETAAKCPEPPQGASKDMPPHDPKNDTF